MKNQKLKIKPEFEKKLKGVKRKFVNNVKKEIGSGYIEYVNNRNDYESSFDGFVSGCFLFSGTPEGHDFWFDISKR